MMQKHDNMVEVADLTDAFEGMELIELTLLNNVGGASPAPHSCAGMGPTGS